MWFDQRGHLPARSKARRPGGLNGFFGPLSFISAGMCGPEMRLLVNIDSQMLLKICATARSPPKRAAKDYHSSNNAYRQLKNSRPPVKPLAPMGNFSFLFSHPLSSPTHQEQIKPCQHEQWRTESALMTDGMNVMDASQALSCCAT